MSRALNQRGAGAPGVADGAGLPPRPLNTPAKEGATTNSSRKTTTTSSRNQERGRRGGGRQRDWLIPLFYTPRAGYEADQGNRAADRPSQPYSTAWGPRAARTRRSGQAGVTGR